MLGKDSIQDNTNFRGYSNLSCFIDYTESLWNKLTTKIIMQPIELVLESVPSARDPFKSYVKVKSINKSSLLLYRLQTNSNTSWGRGDKQI